MRGVSRATQIILLDDGKTGDGVTNDGIYGALTNKLANGEYASEAVAETNGQARIAATSLTVDIVAPTAPNKTANLKTVKR